MLCNKINEQSFSTKYCLTLLPGLIKSKIIGVWAVNGAECFFPKFNETHSNVFGDSFPLLE